MSLLPIAAVIALAMSSTIASQTSRPDDRAARLQQAVKDDDLGTATKLMDDLRAATPPAGLPTLPDGRTLLHIAAQHASPGMMDILLARGLDVNATDALGRTALHRATARTAPALIAAHANFLALDSLGNMPLHYAAERGAEDCAIFVKKRVPVDGRDNAGLSPLHFAVLAGEKSSVEYLLDHGANVNARTLAAYDWRPWADDANSSKPVRVKADRTPLDLALMMQAADTTNSGKHRTIADVLKARGGTATTRGPAFTPARLVYLLISLASLVVMLGGLLFLDAQVTGWHALASRFPATHAPAPPATVNKHQDGGVGRIGLVYLKSLLRASATDDGLYLAFPAMISAGHKPLLIPWNQLSITSDKTVLGIEVLELRVPNENGELIVLRGGIAPEVKRRLAP